MHHRWPSERATLFGSDVEVDGRPIISALAIPVPPPASAWAERVVSIIMELFAITFKHFCLDLLGDDGLILLLLAFRCFMLGIYQTSKGLAAGNTSRYTLIFI